MATAKRKHYSGLARQAADEASRKLSATSATKLRLDPDSVAMKTLTAARTSNKRFRIDGLTKEQLRAALTGKK